jgi:hypothetical protein
MCEILTHIMLKGLHHEIGFFLHLQSGCFKMFEKHLKKTTNGYVYFAKRSWIQNVQGVYLFTFALLSIGRQAGHGRFLQRLTHATNTSQPTFD